jgi:hypothetical protein
MASYSTEPPLQPPVRDGKPSAYNADVEKGSAPSQAPMTDREHFAKHEKQRQDDKSTPAVVVDVFAAQEGGGGGPDYR